MSLLVEIANYIQRYLNEQNISCVIGRHKLLLDKKAVSELLEKYSIDALMTKFGDTLEVKKRTAYDFSLSLNKEKIYVNIKTQDLETSQLSEVTWISSKSVIESQKRKFLTEFPHTIMVPITFYITTNSPNLELCLQCCSTLSCKSYKAALLEVKINTLTITKEKKRGVAGDFANPRQK